MTGPEHFEPPVLTPRQECVVVVVCWLAAVALAGLVVLGLALLDRDDTPVYVGGVALPVITAGLLSLGCPQPCPQKCDPGAVCR